MGCEIFGGERKEKGKTKNIHTHTLCSKASESAFFEFHVGLTPKSRPSEHVRRRIVTVGAPLQTNGAK